MSVESKIDRLTELVQDQSEEIAKITIVLGGSGMGDKGLIEQMSELKNVTYKNKQEVSRLKWFAGLVAGGISAIITGAAAYFKS